MPDGIGPRSLAERFFWTCLLILGGMILLTLALDLLAKIWWVLLIAVVVIVAAVVLVRWWWHRNTWL